MSFLHKVLTTRNVGKLDRLLRLLPAPIVGLLIYGGHVQGLAAWGLGVASAMLLVTAVTGTCSIYYMLGLSTCPISGKPRPE